MSQTGTIRGTLFNLFLPWTFSVAGYTDRQDGWERWKDRQQESALPSYSGNQTWKAWSSVCPGTFSLPDSWLRSKGTMKPCGFTECNQSERGSPAPLEQWEDRQASPGWAAISGYHHAILQCSKHQEPRVCFKDGDLLTANIDYPSSHRPGDQRVKAGNQISFHS